MKTSAIWMKVVGLLFCLLPGMGQADVNLTGKLSSKVTAHVTRANNLFVTDENGGWYEQGLEMIQPGAFNSPYEIDVPLRITSSSGQFQVRMDSPLELQNQENPQLAFHDMAVKMGLIGAIPQSLSVGANALYSNPSAVQEGEDSIGHYLLNITGYVPAGEFKQVTGIYSGVLSLTFEPVLED